MSSGTQQQERTLVAPALFPLSLGRLEVVAPSRPQVDEAAERATKALRPQVDEATKALHPAVDDAAEQVTKALQELAQPAALPVRATDVPGVARWRALLPELEAELARELKAFRRAMRGAKVAPDYLNRDIVPTSKSGAWQVLHAEQVIDGKPLAFSLYVRRCTNQLAVNENASRHGLSPLFTQAFPWDLPSADDVRLGLQARLRTCAARR